MLSTRFLSKSLTRRSCHTPTKSLTTRGTRHLLSTNASGFAAGTTGGAGGNQSKLPWVQSDTRISTLFGVLVAIGVGSTAYGLYEFYSSFTMWPKEVRGDLRAGIKAKLQGNLNTSERYLQRALDTALTLPLDVFAPNPHLKLSGIAITLGEVLELAHKPAEAYDVYVAALDRLRAVSGTPQQQQEGRLTTQERVRAAAIAYKLGEMARTYSQPIEEEEKWLVFAVEELLKVLRDEQHARTSAGGRTQQPSSSLQKEEGDEKLGLKELELPAWVSREDVVGPLEALGAFYHSVGKPEYAIPLYLSSLSILHPHPTHQTTAETRCQGAHIMNSLASTIISHPLSLPPPPPPPPLPTSTSSTFTTEPTFPSEFDQRLQQAEAWVNKAIAVAQAVQNELNGGGSFGGEENQVAATRQQCEVVLAAALFNKGSLKEISGSMKEAKTYYTTSKQRALAAHMREGVIEAEAALRRLDRMEIMKEVDDIGVRSQQAEV